MNPASLLESVAGGGASSGVADQSTTSASGNTGAKNIGVSANPNAAARAAAKLLESPAVLLLLAVLAFFLLKKLKG